MKLPFFVVVLMGATTALSHEGVQNAAVMARMHSMSVIAAQMKTLGQMAKGTTGFDAGIARTAASVIAEHAAQTPALFKAAEQDPKSEARPEIWTSFEKFTVQAAALATLANGLSASIGTKKDLNAGMAALGQACTSCHTTFRQ